MSKKIVIIIISVVILIIASIFLFLFLRPKKAVKPPVEKQQEKVQTVDPKNPTFTIKGLELPLKDGYTLTVEEERALNYPIQKIVKVALTPIKNEPGKFKVSLKVFNAPDSDGDGVVDHLEEYYGTDPHNIDTDGDGLTDAMELFGNTGTDPLKKDSDSDGVSDYDEYKSKFK